MRSEILLRHKHIQTGLTSTYNMVIYQGGNYDSCGDWIRLAVIGTLSTSHKTSGPWNSR